MVEQTYFSVAAINALVEDSAGDLINLVLYNYTPLTSTSEDAQRILPRGSRVAIKEPYLKCFNTGYLGFRVDNPANTLFILPPEVVNDSPIDQLKVYGNTAFKKKLFLESIYWYERGIQRSDQFLTAAESALKAAPASSTESGGASSSVDGSPQAEALDPPTPPPSSSLPPIVTTPSSADPVLLAAVRDTLLNLCISSAAAHLALGNHRHALFMCERALGLEPHSAKVLYRKVKACVGLQDFATARALCDAVLAAPGDDLVISRELSRVRDALPAMERQQRGEFDFDSIEFNPAKQDFILNYFGEKGKLAILPAGNKGRGLFLGGAGARKGELLIVEKPLAYSLSASAVPQGNASDAAAAGDQSKAIFTSSNAGGLVTTADQISIVSEIVLHATRNPHFNAVLSQLSSTPDSIASCPTVEEFYDDGKAACPVLSARAVLGIVHINAYGIPLRRDLNPSPAERRAFAAGEDIDSAEAIGGHGGGLYPVCSMLNHSPRPNTTRRFVGKFMFVNALEDLPPGVELTAKYHDDPAVLLEKWGIVNDA